MLQEIQAPTNCPSCNSSLEWVNFILYCRNSTCDHKVEKKIEHFAKSLRIKGLGPATIKKLNLNDITELYYLHREDIAEALSSDKLAEKLFYEIENSKKVTLNRLLPAFSIPLMGKTAAEKLSTVCNSINDITDTTCRQAGLGPKATENLLHWLDTDYPLLKGLPFSFDFERSQPTETRGVVCITGKLKSFTTKTFAEAALNDHGYTVHPRITKQVTILINESGIESAKTKRARDSGITIVTNLLELIGE